MRFSHLILAPALALSVAGCVQTKEPTFSSRGSEMAQFTTSSEALMSDQTAALTKMTKDIIRKSTAKGAAIGAVAGCGLVLLSASNAKNCVGGALAGGAVGTIVGNAAGQKKAAQRIELVSPNALVRSIGKADRQMTIVVRDLPAMLKQQDAELAGLNANLQNGQITEAQFAHRFEVIKANRAQLVQALSLSAAQANQAHRNLQAAKAKGQTGLDWHLIATKNLAQQATSSRSAISLL